LSGSPGHELSGAVALGADGGYLFHGRQDGARQGVVQVPGLSLFWRLPTLIVWLSHGLRGPGVAW
jgi:hypothetical protein